MKRFFIVAAVVSIVAVFGLVSMASAQDTTPPTQPGPGQGYGRWGGGPGMMGDVAQPGPMHEYMEAAMADALGLTEAQLEDRHANGETFWQIAEAQGYTLEEAQQMMLDARSAALDEMVKDGAMTPEQAEWMKNRSGRMFGGGAGRGQGGCMGGVPNLNGAGNSRGMGGRWSRDG